MPEIREATDAEKIAAVLAGNHGTVQVDYQLWQSNIYGTKKYQIPTVQDAEVNLSNYRDYTWEMNLTLAKDEAIDPFLDYVKLVMRVKTSYYETDDWVEFPLGLYRLVEPRGTDNPFYTTWELTGQSLEAILLDNMAATGYKVAESTQILTAVKTILTDQGVPASRIKFPASSVALAGEMVFSPFQDAEKCYWLRIINALLAAGGFYALYTDNEGYFVTKEIEDTVNEEVAITYLANGAVDDEGEELITEEIQWEYEREFYNKVTVYSSEATGGVPIVWTAALRTTPGPAATNTSYIVDPDNDFAYGSPMIGNKYFTRPPESFEKITTDAEAQKLAKALLRRSATRQERLTITTVPDPRRGAREDYWIKARRSDGDMIYHMGSGTGSDRRKPLDDKFRVVGWTLPLDGQSGMTHEVTRLLKG